MALFFFFSLIPERQNDCQLEKPQTMYLQYIKIDKYPGTYLLSMYLTRPQPPILITTTIIVLMIILPNHPLKPPHSPIHHPIHPRPDPPPLADPSPQPPLPPRRRGRRRLDNLAAEPVRRGVEVFREGSCGCRRRWDRTACRGDGDGLEVKGKGKGCVAVGSVFGLVPAPQA